MDPEPNPEQGAHKGTNQPKDDDVWFQPVTHKGREPSKPQIAPNTVGGSDDDRGKMYCESNLPIRFRGSIALLLLQLFVFCGMALCASSLAVRPTTTVGGSSDLLFRTCTSLMGLLILLYFGYGLLQGLTTYEFDDLGITRRAWNGRRRICWADISRFEAIGGPYGSIALFDTQGTKIPIQLALLRRDKASELRHVLEPRLAPMRARQSNEVISLGSIPVKPRGLLALIYVVTVPLAIFLLSQAFSSGGIMTQNDIVSQALFVSFAVLFALLAFSALIMGLTLKLTITTDGIRLQSWFTSKYIAFDDITWMTSRLHQTKDEYHYVACICSDTQEIRFSDQMRHYDAVLSYICKRAPTGTVRMNEPIGASRGELVFVWTCLAVVCLSLIAFSVHDMTSEGSTNYPVDAFFVVASTALPFVAYFVSKGK